MNTSIIDDPVLAEVCSIMEEINNTTDDDCCNQVTQLYNVMRDRGGYLDNNYRGRWT